MVQSNSLLTDFDISLLQGGKHFRLYEKLGSHIIEHKGERGVQFAVWAPHAKRVSVTGDFNSWNPETHVLYPRWDKSGIWEGFIPGLDKGTVYKYHVTMYNGVGLDKGDPYAMLWETPPRTASVVWEFDYQWKDKSWLAARTAAASQPKPWSVYEVHLGSWKKIAADGNRSLNYREMAVEMVAYVKEMGFTHVEFMPVTEHPYFPSWGYQVTGFFAPTSRFGSPEDFMHLIDAFHEAGIGVILDWVPSHFPGDIHGLYLFDGTHLYEYADMRKGFHPDWNSYVFDYGRNEVRSFLMSSAMFWLDRYHVDGLRVDAVASMLYLDYSRKEGEWIPNIHGGRENLEAISFLKEFNDSVYKEYPGVETIAEESTAFPGVSKPTFDGGLGFGQKWMMGWMHDSLSYFKRPPLFRRWHQNEITFSMVYAFSERFMLALSHDEVVHLKSSLLYKMPGDEWQKFANLRALLGFQWMHPGTHLLFMGGEIGQSTEWSHDRGIVWELLEHAFHKGIQEWVKALNACYNEHPALWWNAFSPEGYEWISGDDVENSVLVFLRKGRPSDKTVLVVCHFGAAAMEQYTVGVPVSGDWAEELNSDDKRFGGTGMVNGKLTSDKQPSHGHAESITFKLPALSVQIFVGPPAPKSKVLKEPVAAKKKAVKKTPAKK
ncbi:MAG: 1,4-alpha-glucan branching protein GlgB [Lewinellaceae bacterium]|nr:1,4-alpha-glucan branching protein GlgB [Lewinellaceae bacterium]